MIEYKRIIEPPSGVINLNIRELYLYREVLYSLVHRYIYIRYNDTILGSAYAVLFPVFNMIVFTFLFGYIAKIPTGDIPYPVFSYSGLILWAFFSTGVNGAAGSIVANAGIITKIYFPRLFYPLTPCIGSLFDYGISLIILILLMFWFGLSPGLSILILPIVLFGTLLLTVGVGCIFASITVVFRDMQFLSSTLLSILMYTSPIIYPISVIPDRFAWILYLNPITGLINAHRQCLLGQTVDIVGLGIGILISVVIFTIGIVYLKKAEHYFADII